MAVPKPVILIARPRSGTTAFRDLLEGHPQLAVRGEIFHNQHGDKEDYYYHYFLQSVTRDPNLALPSAGNVARLFRGYIEHITDWQARVRKPKEWLLLSVNYNSLHVMNTFWQNFYQPPHLLTIIKHSNYHVIHMIRRNVVEAALSQLRAQRTGFWHLRDGETAPPEAAARVVIAPQPFLAELRARQLEIELIETALRRYPHCLTLEYETLYDDAGRSVPAAMARVEEFLGLRHPVPIDTRFRRTRSANPGDWVENYDALRDALAGTEFAAQLAP
jgi:hypothetical protein